MQTWEEHKQSIIDKYQALVPAELIRYLDEQRGFFADDEIRIIDFEFNPDHDGELIISFLVTGEDNWENKAQKESDYYKPDWKFYLYNIDIVPSKDLNHALHIDFMPEGWHEWEDIPNSEFYTKLFIILSDIIKSDAVMSVIRQYNLADNFRIQFIDERNNNDYCEHAFA